MARENKLPYLKSTDIGYHTKIIEDLGDKYKCYNCFFKKIGYNGTQINTVAI